MSDQPESYAVDLVIMRDPTSADNEWNYLSQMYVHRLGAKLISIPDVSSLSMEFVFPRQREPTVGKG